MTQALAVQEILSRWGHEVVGVVAGMNSTRALPSFFTDAFEVPVKTLSSPGFVFSNSRSVDVTATVWQVFRNMRQYRRSIGELDNVVQDLDPDLIINFFEPLTGLWQRQPASKTPVIAVGHQYMIHHPTYVKLRGHRSQQLGMRLFVRLVGGGAVKLALSFYEAPDLPNQRLLVCPPILRQQLFEIFPDQGDYVLAYLVNHGYAQEIEAWHAQNRSKKLHCFYDKPGAPECYSPHPNLTFHMLNGEKFLHMMAGCRAVLCTAGFESVSEAAWLGKPLFMVPVQNHIEQMINALDAVNLGFGITAPRFDLDRLKELPLAVENEAFKQWVAVGETVIARAIRTATQSSRSGAVTPSISTPDWSIRTQ